MMKPLVWRAALALSVPLLFGGCSAISEGIAEVLRMKPDYYLHVSTGGPLEARYTGLGPEAVESLAFTQDGRSYKVWYPSEIERSASPLPAVVMSNGSGVLYPAYEATFQHLASWGFIVIGDDEGSTATGASVSAIVDRLSALNQQPGPFLRKVDMGRIGVSGHSQGAVGAVNAIVRSQNGPSFKSAYLASMTSLEVIENMKWPTWRYDTAQVKIPVFIVAGTGGSDSESISPLASMTRAYDSLRGNGTTVLARRRAAEHGDMLVKADGYMTAWFRYTLLNDREAAAVFSGPRPEIANNPANWQDVRLK